MRLVVCRYVGRGAMAVNDGSASGNSILRRAVQRAEAWWAEAHPTGERCVGWMAPYPSTEKA